MRKKFLFVLLSFFLFFLIIEITSRSFIFIFTKNYKIFKYGFNENISFQIRKLSTFNFEVIDNSKLLKKKIFENKRNKNKNKKIIWTFGGSTSDVACRKENKTSWPLELNDKTIKVKNFAKSGTNSDFALNTLISIISKDQIPDIILWANYVNETDVITFGFERNKFLSKKVKQDIITNRTIYFLKSLSKSIKNYSVFYFLLDDLSLRIVSRLNLTGKFYNINKQLTKNDLLISAKNYYINTNHAINLAKQHNIKFYIVTLFSKSNILNPNLFVSKDEIFSNMILKIIDEHKNVQWINLKQNQKIEKLPDVNKAFCDNIHFTKYGNILVSKLIKNYLINR